MKRMSVVIAGLMMVASHANAQAGDWGSVFRSSYEAEAAGKLADAYTIVNNASGGSMSNYPAVMRLAYLKGLMGQPRDAARLYRTAGEIEPAAVEPILYQQYQYILLGDSGNVVLSAREGLKRDPQNYVSRTRLAYALYQMKKYSEAAEEYSKVAALYPLDLDVAVMQGWSFAQLGLRARARGIFQKVLTVSPDNVSAKEGMAFLR